jgi:hypothetical protein
MNNHYDKRIHALLDETDAPPTGAPGDAATLTPYRAALERLGNARVHAPARLAADIMAALPQARRKTALEWLAGFLPERRQWAAPGLVGALAMLLAIAGVWHFMPQSREPRVRVHFEVHAPGAQRVELAGDFNNWAPGAIRLRGPDASGHWTADIDLPEGRYEYQFLVNGKTWITDPNATAHRPDGFGRENAVMDVCDERS